MISDFEDDTHYCLKCHSTIIGLDNYVSHRKSSCGKTLNNSAEITKSVIPTQLLQPEHDDPFSLKADDFFSSLELQSSAKKPANSTAGGKISSGVLTRSKASAVIQASSSAKDCYNYLDHIKTESSEWISDHTIKSLENDNNQSRSDAKRKEDHTALEVYGESEDESDEYEYENEDSDYEDEEDNHHAPPRSFTGGKWKPTSSPIQWLRPSSQEDRDWNAPPPHHTGAKWKPPTSTKPVDSTNLLPVEQSGSKWKSTSSDVPPANFTGSKWTSSKIQISKHASPDMKGKLKPRPELTKSVVSEKNIATMSSESKWEYEPPPEHTKGKWKPTLLTTRPEESQIEAISESYTTVKWKPTSVVVPQSSSKSCLEKIAPPSTYTKGKWKPPVQNDALERPREKWLSRIHPTLLKKGSEVSPFRKSSGTVQYWCGPCNRRLASKVVYERHLKSELHFKRTLHDREFDDTSYENVNFVAKKRTVRKSTKYSTEADVKGAVKDLDNKSNKIRRKIFVTCDVCKSRVNLQLMGKHLISHYHCRKGDINSPESQRMILDNIHLIILQSPYQCSPCKFYCNTHECFLQHWLSKSHKDIAVTSQSFFWCSVCKFHSENSERMYEHLLSKEHTEMISVINRSVPVIIKRIAPIRCLTCSHQFQFNIQLRKHCERENHSHSLTCSDEYQSKHKCNQCDAVLKSRIALQRHQIQKHNEKVYICSVCSLNFDNILEAKRHRSSPEHRCAVLGKRQQEGREKDLTKKCQYCSKIFQNILQLKDHLKDQHPEHNHSCPLCGKMFLIAQEVTVHVRTKSCNFDGDDDDEEEEREEDESKNNFCDQCQFKTHSSSELLFHKVLHGEPLLMYSNSQDGTSSEKQPIPQYKCPICQKIFVKSSLRCHLRIHTKERPFVCSKCNASFVRKNNWALHMKNHERKSVNKLVTVNQTAEFGERPFLCSTCGASFKRRNSCKTCYCLYSTSLATRHKAKFSQEIYRR